MGGHGHDHEPYKIPDYRIYKVEDVPLLVKTQKALAARGLRDPWLRNEVWRYNPKVFGTESERTRLLFLRGFRTGLVACIITVVATEFYDRMFPSKHGHEDGHGHH